MNEHGRHAMEIMKKHDPQTYAQIADPETHFSTLGEEMAERILDLSRQLAPKRTADQDTLEILGNMNMAKLRAREMVYQEMIYDGLPQEPEEMEPDYYRQQEEES
jgi:hypothetical protein